MNHVLANDLLRSVVEHSVDGLLVIDADGIVRFANTAAVNMFAGKTDRLLGFQLGVPAIHEPVELVLPNGSDTRYVEMRARDVAWEGRPASLVSLTDITERNLVDAKLQTQAEDLRRHVRQFQSLVEGAPEAILVITGLVFAYVNPAACRLFGAASAEELLNQPLLDRIDPSVHGLVRARIHKVFDDREPAPTVEQLWIRMDGKTFPVEVSSVPTTYLGKDSALAFARDITERKRTEEAQRKSRQFALAAAEANAANKAKSLFLSTMSHEIRTPMNAIMGYSQLMLRDTSLGNSARESLKVIKRSGEHLLNILNNILDMAKIESGRLEITPVTFNLGRHVQDLEAMFRLPAQAKELQLEVRLGGEPVEYITADEGKLRQVLINLLGNAIKFTQRGRVELRVSLDRRSPSDQDLTARSDEGLWLSAHVEDTGIGMTPAEIARLFEPFVQGKAGKHIQQGGTGLGLAISREVARSLGGDITVTSSPGSGSTFHFEVPVRSSTALHFMGQSVRRGRILGIRAEQAPRVLIADDMPDNREWLMRLLTALGFSVRAVENGEAAVQVHAEWKPRLVLMDVHMPGMDGLDATRRIRSTPSGNSTAIIALTADAMEQQRANAFASGVDTFISKPCAEDELLEKILKHLPEIAYTYEDEPFRQRERQDRLGDTRRGKRRAGD